MSHTFASAHPELLVGEFAPRPTWANLLSQTDRTASHPWLAARVVIPVLVIAVLVLPPFLGGHDSSPREPLDATACGRWDMQARVALVGFVNAGGDAGLQKVSDGALRMRRARRNCETGWLSIACRDYQAVISGAPALSASGSGTTMCRS